MWDLLIYPIAKLKQTFAGLQEEINYKSSPNKAGDWTWVFISLRTVSLGFSAHHITGGSITCHPEMKGTHRVKAVATI